MSAAYFYLVMTGVVVQASRAQVRCDVRCLPIIWSAPSCPGAMIVRLIIPRSWSWSWSCAGALPRCIRTSDVTRLVYWNRKVTATLGLKHFETSALSRFDLSKSACNHGSYGAALAGKRLKSRIIIVSRKTNAKL